MLFEELRNLAVVLIRDQAHRNLGRGFRGDHRLGAFTCVAAPDAIDIERRTHARAFQRRVARFALHVADFQRFFIIFHIERRLVERLALPGRQFAHIVVEAGDRYTAAIVYQTGHQPRQHVGRIGHGAAEEPRVEVLVRPRHFNLHISQPSQTACDRGRLHRDHRGVRHQYNIGCEHLLVLLTEAVKARRTDLLLAFHHEFDVTGQRIRGAHRLESLGVHPQLPLVVVRSAAPDAALLDDGFERLRAPLAARVHGHHVVVAVDQYRFGFRIDDLFGINHRIALRGQYVGTVSAGLGKRRGEELRATLHVGFVFALRADRRDAQQIEQLTDKPFLILLYINFCFIHWSMYFMCNSYVPSGLSVSVVWIPGQSAAGRVPS